jgi:predicted O-methyltransferase YrrM
VRSLERALSVPRGRVEELLGEVAANTAITAMEARIKLLPYSGIFRGGPELYCIVRQARPKIVLETGVGTGYSSSFILEALEANGNGRLTSIDQPNQDQSWKLPPGEGPGFLVRTDLKSRWTLVLGKTRELLPEVTKMSPEIDMFFHDSEHTYDTMMFEYETAMSALAPGGLLLSDDSMWNTALLDFTSRHHLSIRYVYHRGGSAPFTVVQMPTSIHAT